MPEVLRAIGDSGDVRALRSPSAVLDPTTAGLLAAAVEEAEARGRREGELAGRAAAQADTARAAAAVAGAVDTLRAEVVEQRATATRASLELARASAAAVLERTPPDDAASVLDRVGRAIEVLDDDPLTVRLHPGDVAALGPVTVDGFTLVPDPMVARGDARVAGRHSGAELTRAAMLDAALDVLAADEAAWHGTEDAA